MGYRSEIAIKCEEKAFELFAKSYKKNSFAPDGLYKEDDLYTLHWSWVKWYEEYPEVQEIMDIMDELDTTYEYMDGYRYRFVRIGEEFADIDQRENTCEIELYISRSIDYLPLEANRIDLSTKEEM